MEEINSLSWQGCKEWLKAHPDTEGFDELGTNPGVCWVGACYILDTLGTPFRNGTQQPPPYKNNMRVDELLNMRGWVHCVADCDDEIHYFSLFIESEEKTTLVHVYGTLKKIEINLKNWIKLYKKGEWKKLFDIPKNAPARNKVDSIILNRL
jgi:hypothetical protein